VGTASRSGFPLDHPLVLPLALNWGAARFSGSVDQWMEWIPSTQAGLTPVLSPDDEERCIHWRCRARRGFLGDCVLLGGGQRGSGLGLERSGWRGEWRGE
jgi:hypothetical protein